ncbi:MAG: SAM-dependent methyltransferase, partial [Acidobacteria bacterium ACB2]|nr:SAM-dependent methyltransferase [Acidobacteria bacterium ACB2]
MKGVRALALEVLVRVETERAWAAPLLDARGASLSPRDRDLLRALVKTTLRFAIRLDHVLSRHVSGGLARLDPAVRNGLRLGAAQLLLMDRIPSHAAVGESVAAVKGLSARGAGLANAVLRRVA